MLGPKLEIIMFVWGLLAIIFTSYRILVCSTKSRFFLSWDLNLQNVSNDVYRYDKERCMVVQVTLRFGAAGWRRAHASLRIVLFGRYDPKAGCFDPKTLLRECGRISPTGVRYCTGNECWNQPTFFVAPRRENLCREKIRRFRLLHMVFVWKVAGGDSVCWGIFASTAKPCCIADCCHCQFLVLPLVRSRSRPVEFCSIIVIERWFFRTFSLNPTGLSR